MREIKNPAKVCGLNNSEDGLFIYWDMEDSEKSSRFQGNDLSSVRCPLDI